MPEKLDKIRLDHNSYISLHVQLHNQLRRLIVSGRWRNGERIPTEMQLSRHLDISRTTVRIATQRLEVEGLIKRSAGRGTFVIYQAQEHAANRSIGYLTCSFHNEIHTNILSSAQTELRSAGYQVIFSNSQDREDEARILRQLLDDDVAGLMLWANAEPTDETLSILAEYDRREIPIVFMDRPIEGIRADYVASDNFRGSYDLVCYLIQLGHRHIVQLMPNFDDLLPVNERRRGYRTAMEEHGIVVHAPWRISQPGRHEFHETDIYSLVGSQSQQIIRQVEQFTDAEEPMPTAIVCINDILAIIAISALRNMGFAVPEDVSVVGFDDISMASHIGVPLTTASQDAYELGKAGSQMLLDRLVGGDLPPRSYTVPTQLRVRASTAAPLVGVEDALQT
ncbi:MAG: GntR family transcriptional regulator [Chloroflexi bacterium]|nr:GntR family transcriptional regulator [Chloroflexota bacterium]